MIIQRYIFCSDLQPHTGGGYEIWIPTRGPNLCNFGNLTDGPTTPQIGIDTNLKLKFEKRHHPHAVDTNLQLKFKKRHHPRAVDTNLQLKFEKRHPPPGSHKYW